VNRTLCRRNHALFSDHATQEQERRASARRGIEKRVCNGGRFSRCDYVCHGTPRFRTTAGLRQPLLVVRRQLVVYARLRFATVFCFPRGAYAPRSCCSANVCRRKNDFCDARTHIHKSGGRQPAVVCDTYDVREEWSAVRVRPNRH
jgi:hypothetical protein